MPQNIISTFIPQNSEKKFGVKKKNLICKIKPYQFGLIGRSALISNLPELENIVNIVGVFYEFIYFYCIGSSLLHMSFLQLRRAGATLCCGAQASHCGGSSCCGARALGCAGFSSSGSQALKRRLSSVAHRLSCSAACGIFPDQGSNPCPLHWQADS